MKKDNYLRVQLNLFDELVVDNFAGGGGASTGIELAIGRPVDIAINHDPEAIKLHKMNHPFTKHYCESVWEVDPREVCKGRKVALCWLSPDCKHFSKAKGGKPRDKTIRGLAWVAVRWAATVKPSLLILENVEEFQTWGPLDANGFPIKKEQGRTFRSFVNALKAQGYEVAWKELRACDYGAPTIRKRFFLIARCDGKPIVFPEPTHGPEGSGLLPYKTAAEIIDWSLPCKSIFDRKKPLADNTMRRIARGIDKYVLKNPNPFLVQVNHGGEGFRGQSLNGPMPTVTAKHGFGVVTPVITSLGHTSLEARSASVTEPLRTIVSKAEHCITAPKLVPYMTGKNDKALPYLIQYHSETQDGQVRGQQVNEPIRTVDAANRYGLTVPFISQYYAGGYKQAGQPVEKPLPTITAVDHNWLAAANLTVLRNNMDGMAQQVSFLTEYYGKGNPLNLNEPLHTVTSKDREALVSAKIQKVEEGADLMHWPKVRKMLNEYCGYNLADDEILLLTIDSVSYFISDVGLRMLTPRELYNAQGFPPDYIIQFSENGKEYSKAQQVARCGNAVPPPFAEALVRANLPELCGKKYTTMEDLHKDIAI